MIVNRISIKGTIGWSSRLLLGGSAALLGIVVVGCGQLLQSQVLKIVGGWRPFWNIVESDGCISRHKVSMQQDQFQENQGNCQ